MINFNDFIIKNWEILNGLLTIRIDYDLTTGNPIYMGLAKPGSDELSPVWAIKSFEYDTNGNLIAIKWANGNTNFDKVWNDRTTYTYS